MRLAPSGNPASARPLSNTIENRNCWMGAFLSLVKPAGIPDGRDHQDRKLSSAAPSSAKTQSSAILPSLMR